MNEQLKQVLEIKAKISKEIECKIAEMHRQTEERLTEINTLILEAKSVFPDYKSPFTTDEPTTPPRGSRGSIRTEIVNVLSEDVAHRLTQKALVERFESQFSGSYVYNTVNKLVQDGTIINGFTVKQIQPPEDAKVSFIKVKVG